MEAAIELGPLAPLASIAERAGVGVASLHRYFPTTAAILAEVSRRGHRAMVEQIRELSARDDLDLRAMVREVCRVALEGPGLSLSHRQRLNLEIPLVWSLGAAEESYREALELGAAWIRRSMRAPPADLDARIFVGFASIRGAVLMVLAFPALAPRDVLPTLAESVYVTLTGDMGDTPQPSGGGRTDSAMTS